MVRLGLIEHLVCERDWKRIMWALISGTLFLFPVWGWHFPPNVKHCHRSEQNFMQCFVDNMGPGIRSLANGNKYYGIPKLEPLFVEQIDLEGKQSQTMSINQKYKNVYFHGITTSSAENIGVIDLDKKCGWVVLVTTPVIRMEADYELNGKMLLFTLNGQGKCNVTMYNMRNTQTMTCEKYTVKDKTYLKITNYTLNLVVDDVRFDFPNLFPGNEQISNEILKTMNENSLSIFEDVKRGFEQVLSAIHIVMANKFFSKEPIDQVFLD